MTTTHEGTQRDELAQIKVQTKGHTPGPWVYHASIGRVEDVPEFDLHRFDIMATDIAKVEVSDADGELIAAAPKLLAALEAIQKLVDETPRLVCFGGETVCGSIMTDSITEAITEALR